MIAALFVERGGAYWNLEGVDPWDEERDARLYAGPWPVVAHPPCQLWVNFAALNYKRYGGEHNRPGNDGGCFASALASVRRWGGVLEHPAFSNAWRAHGIWPWEPNEWWKTPGWHAVMRRDVYPGNGGWRLRTLGWICEVWQSAYGHRARKRTWLFYWGGNEWTMPPNLDWRRPSGSAQVGWFDRKKPTLGKRESNATPPAFRDALLSLARSVSQERAA